MLRKADNRIKCIGKQFKTPDPKTVTEPLNELHVSEGKKSIVITENKN